jgi:hypothetical protein
MPISSLTSESATHVDASVVKAEELEGEHHRWDVDELDELRTELLKDAV